MTQKETQNLKHELLVKGLSLLVATKRCVVGLAAAAALTGAVG